jgi:hypothetical protein
MTISYDISRLHWVLLALDDCCECGKLDWTFPVYVSEDEVNWLESYIERLKQSPGLFDCPRCGGTGEYSIETEDGCGCTTSCRACHGSGRVTKEDWNSWCDYLASLTPSAPHTDRRDTPTP